MWNSKFGVRRRAPGRPLSLRRREAGQALIIAVLVLFAVATLAALLVAIIGSQLAQVARHSDVVKLRNIAEGGLRFANEQLTYSQAGADWRPGTDVPYRSGQGLVDLSVSYAPRPGDVQTRFLRVVASSYFPDNPFLRYTVVALKPLLLTDYVRFITDRFETDEPAVLGASGVVLGKGLREEWLFRVDGPIRSNTSLMWYGPSQISLHTSEGVVPVADGGSGLGRAWGWYDLLRDDRIEVAGRLFADPWRNPASGLIPLNVNNALVSDDLFTDARFPQGFPARDADDNPIPNMERILANAMAVPRIRPPVIDDVDPDLQINRYLALTRDSGNWQLVGTTFYNTGWYGWGWRHLGGIYIDNKSDLQYQDAQGNRDLDKLRLNWLNSVGHHQDPNAPMRGDQRAVLDAPPGGPSDWWDKTGRYYAPPGAEIILHGEADCPYIEMIRHDQNWREPNGDAVQVGVGSSADMGLCNAATWLGVLSDGKTARFPFPPNGVIYAEGNLRIRGVLPPKRGDPAGYLDAANRQRRFDLTVVSGGTIYIEGDLLTPRSAGLIADTLEADMAWGSRIALLARDSVCVNTTALNPRPENLTSGWRQFRQVEVDGTLYNYNDAQPLYRHGGWRDYFELRGPQDEATNLPDAAIAWALAGDPAAIFVSPDTSTFVYNSLRLRLPLLRDEILDLRLILGHSALHSVGGASGQPSDPWTSITGDVPDVPRVSVGITFENPDGTWAWDILDSARYTFWSPDSTPDPAAEDVSGHWCKDPTAAVVEFGPDPAELDDYLELLPNPYQSLLVQDPANALYWLTDGSHITFDADVWPVVWYVKDSGGNWVADRWEIAPQELSYLLGPVAVTPPRGAAPLRVEIDALVYAQNGSWFILPGPWFNEDPDEADPADYTLDHPGYREPLNIQLSFWGAISENSPAAAGDVAEWTSKWSGPFGVAWYDHPSRLGRGWLTYKYDPLLRYPRSHLETGGATSTWVRFPNFPVTSDLVIWGERVSW